MKFCENCGTQLEDTAIFCENCGAQQSQQTELQQFSKVGKKLSKKVWIPVVIAVLVIAAAITVYMQIRKRVDINKYITVEYSGYDTVGTASYKIDADGLTQAILKAQGKKSSQTALDSLSGYSVYDMARGYLEVSLDKTQDLSNGDTVTVSVKCDQFADSVLGVKFVYKDQEHKVEGLEQAKEVDIFNDVTVTFSGISPNAKVKISNLSSDSYLGSLDLKASKTKEIKTGDTITVTVSVDEREALRQGYRITQLSKDYVCDKLDQYITSVDSLSSEQMEKLKKTAQDKIEAYFAQNSISGSINSYAGAYTLVSKSSSASNKVYIVYTADVTANTSYSGTDTTTQTVYIPVYLTGVLLKTDGTVSYDSKVYMSGSTKIGYWTYVQGYSKGEDMYKELITAQKDKYTYTVSGDIKQFGE